jgi:serine/threonine protein kinase
VKILDFGLAKVLAWEQSGVDLSELPIASGVATEEGRILGTPAYMSPEQVRGKPVDKQTDIWAFGCVLYELLTGKHAFDRETLTDTIAAVLEHEPDWRAMPFRLQSRRTDESLSLSLLETVHLAFGFDRAML